MNKFLEKFSFKYRFIISFVVLEILFLSMIAVVNYQAIEQSTEQFLKSKEALLRKLGGGLLTTPVSIYDTATIDSVLHDMIELEGVEGVKVWDYDGNLLSHIGNTVENRFVSKFEERVFLDDMKIGTFAVWINSEQNIEFLNTNYNTTVAIIILEIVLSTIISWIIGNKINNSYRKLQEERNLFIEGPSLVFKWRNGPLKKCEYVSKNVNSILGYRDVEFLRNGVLFLKLIYKEDIHRFIEEESEGLNSGSERFVHQPYRLVTKYGEEKWFEEYTTTIRNSSGEVTHYYGFIFEISNLKDKEKKLEISNRYIRSILDAQHNIIILTDGDRIKDANRSLSRYFNRDIDSLEELNQFFAPEDGEEYLNLEVDNTPWLEYVVESSEQRHKVKMVVDGKSFIFLLKASRLYMDSEYIGDILSFEDITLSENYQIELKKEIEKGVEALREKDRFLIQQSRLASMGEMIGNIAHQWRQPLNNLGLIVQDLQQAYIFEDIDEEYIVSVVDDSMRIINRMSSTIDDFRDFFKPDKEMRSFLISDSINGVLELGSAGLTNSSINIELQVGEIWTSGFPQEYSQVLLNIINNAKDILITKDEKERNIWIRAFRDGDFSVVEIEDSGGGVDEEIIGKIFEPYFTTKHQSDGTGIGLYMSKTIIETNMKGVLSVENGEYGAIFKIETPFINGEVKL
jgi:PAS domain S-box-containing protein